ncbi:MAG: serine/threonine-protein kinase [Acidobacteriota bacterium]
MSSMRNKYRTAIPLAHGGMAEVYRTHDAQLGRTVVLKFLRHDDPALVARLRREARAMARMPTHPNLCAIYDVDAQDGRPFIAMEHVDGPSLHDAAPSLSRRETVEIVATIAAALQRVHAMGLVHRDIKPANIVLGRHRDGTLRPVLIDFGTVWAADARTMTRLGQWVGTPAFMAPEQIVGGHEDLGPPADVYALGVTLYCLLTGVTPFDGGSAVELAQRVLEETPASPRRHAPELSPQLEAIVLRCLRKDPAARYPDAGALAADLTRWLDDRPVDGETRRMTGWRGRLTRRVRQYRGPLRAAVALAIAACLALGALAYRGQMVRTAASRYDRIGQDLEGTVRAIAMSAPRDVRAAQARVRLRIGRLEAALDDAASTARGPLHGAIGRGWLALGDEARALHHLRAAWRASYRSPSIAYAHGVALGMAYEQAMRRAELFEQPAMRRVAQERAARELRQPARDFLVRGRRAPSIAPDYVDALIELYDDRYDAAVAAATRARAVPTRRYEADKLIGRIEWRRSIALLNRGDAHGAWRALHRAGRAYRRARASAPSDRHVLLRICRLRSRQMDDVLTAHPSSDAHRSMSHARAFRDGARVACRQAAQLDPVWSAPWSALATVENRWANLQRQRGDAHYAATLRRARHLAQRAIARDPHSATARGVLGDAHLIAAMAALWSAHGEDPRPQLDLAIKNYRAALRVSDAFSGRFVGLSSAYLLRGRYETSSGLDAEASLRRARSLGLRTVVAHADVPAAHAGLGQVESQRVRNGLLHGRPIRGALRHAIARLKRAHALDPHDPTIASELSVAYLSGAWLAYCRDEPRAPWIRAALAYNNRVVARASGTMNGHAIRAQILLNAARWRLQEGGDPTADLARAAVSVRAHAVASRRASAQTTARLYATWLMREQALLRASAALADGPPSEAAPPDDDAWLAPDQHALLLPQAVEIALLQIRRALIHTPGRAPSAHIARAAHLLERLDVLQVAPYALRERLRGELLLLRAAAASAGSTARRADLDQAEAHWTRAVARNHWLRRDVERLRREARTLAVAR